MSTNAPEDSRYGKHVHPNINGRDARLKIHDQIRKSQNKWKCADLSMRNMLKGLHRFLGCYKGIEEFIS